MLTRRHIRVKVVQSVYAFNQSDYQDLDKQEKFLLYSLDQMMDLYLLMLQLLVSLRDQEEQYLLKAQKKHLATKEEKDPSQAFINNKILTLISTNPIFQEAIKNKKLTYWEQDDEYLSIILSELRQKDWYKEYLSLEAATLKDDRDFISRLYKDVIAPNDKIYDYLEDKRLTWVDDIPIVNTALVKMFGKLSEKNASQVLVPSLYKNSEDRDFAIQLLRKVILHDEKLSQEVEGKTPNWDKERIAELDMIILKLGIAEFLHFPSIPVRATINEYLEISKEYSTPKSSIFINGILDKLVKDFTKADKLNKIGRGLR
ncbi:transcription antitermination factor NusB [Cochleicola gelatinilyticus]|uniref:Antitermination protein NusB n=1 Tax=Cochleicola gelatinilyticus TaxID=1763537 RepID=A0A167EN23_9FLAO|nr:transcription antitermination factor NusB [Cochleicola gelatinilyticus]OAB75702.1 antitermination protein NusB [Cochleicola gelatinilyticus]